MNRHIQLLEDLGAQFTRVAAEAQSASRTPARQHRRLIGSGSPSRTLAVAACLTALLGGTAYAVPATRAAVDGIAGSLVGWVQGVDEDAPGRPIAPGDNAPSWFDDRSGDARLIAETDGVGLFMRRTETDGTTMLQFGLGPGLAVGGTLEDWRKRFGERAVVVLQGPAAFGPRDLLDERGRSPLLGVTTRDVARIELRYAEGPPLRAENGDGGFVLLADAWRPLHELVAYDARGQIRDRTDLSTHDLSYLCEREPGCPPEEASTRP